MLVAGKDLQVVDVLAHALEAEVAGFDDAGVDGPDGDFVRGFALEGRDGGRLDVAAGRLEKGLGLFGRVKGVCLDHGVAKAVRGLRMEKGGGGGVGRFDGDREEDGEREASGRQRGGEERRHGGEPARKGRGRVCGPSHRHRERDLHHGGEDDEEEDEDGGGDPSSASYYTDHTNLDANPFIWIQNHALMDAKVLEKYPFDHAGEGETSLMLSLCPDTVNMAEFDKTAWYAQSALKASKETGDNGVKMILDHFRRIFGK